MSLPAIAFRPCTRSDPTELFILETGGTPAGFFQHYLIADYSAVGGNAARHRTAGRGHAAGIDYLIGEAALTGRGLGTRAIATFTRLVFALYPAIRLVAVAVSQDSIASWRALEKAGYLRCWAGELVSGDRSDEGPMYLYRCKRPAMQQGSNIGRDVRALRHYLRSLPVTGKLHCPGASTGLL